MKIIISLFLYFTAGTQIYQNLPKLPHFGVKKRFWVPADMANDAVTSKSSPTPGALPKDPPETQKDKKNLNPKCSVCLQVFKTLPECLKHELLSHSLQKKNTPKTAVDSRLKAACKFLNTEDKVEERAKIHKALQKCQKGKEVPTILKLLCMDNDSLSLIFTRIQTCLEKELRQLGVVKIYPFGSIGSGLALRDSDIDIYMDSSLIPTRDFVGEAETRLMSQHRGSFNRINYVLQRSQHFVDVFPIRQARVPIIKCKHCDTGFSIDINVCCRSSLENTQFIRDLVHSDNRIRELLLLLKIWAKNMQIIGKSNLTSYCLITMIIFYLQQPWKGNGGEGHVLPILKSVRELQRHCRPQITEGVNYAFDLQSPGNRPKMPRGVTTLELLKGFFRFYKEYNFEDNIISPFNGKTITKVDFTDNKFKEYAFQLATITQYMEGVPAKQFPVDRCMCVQDSFALNHNVARSMLPPSKKYFMLCLENADNICQSLNKSTSSEVLEKILYETVVLPSPPVTQKPDISLILKNVENSTGDISNAKKGLNYFFEPHKADLNCIANFKPDLKDPSAFLRVWCEIYIEDIPHFLSAFYHVDMQTQTHIPQKQQRLDDDNLTHVWHISATVDLWSNRFFQKSAQQTFWEYQMAQTERLHELRRQDAKFSVNLNAILTVSVLPDFMGINVSITLPDGASASELCKKDPLRKFFNSIKNTLQNYNIKEALALEKHSTSATIKKQCDVSVDDKDDDSSAKE